MYSIFIFEDSERDVIYHNIGPSRSKPCYLSIRRTDLNLKEKKLVETQFDSLNEAESFLFRLERNLISIGMTGYIRYER